eukprot:g26563.t1
MLESPSGAANHGARGEPRREKPQETQRSAQTRVSETQIETDRKLVTRLLNRDAEAWAEFLRRFERLIASRVVATCGEVGVEPRSDLVDDCGAELMARLFHADMAGLRRFEGRSKLSTWLAVVVRRTTLELIRRKRRDAANLRPPDSRFDIASIADLKVADATETEDEDARELQEALKQLSESDRRILQLQFEQQLSYAAIARILGITENAEGCLSPAEGASVRERLASDPQLLEHWKTLTQAVQSPTPLNDGRDLADIDLELVAAFVEGTLNPHDALHFEHQCWNTPAALREVVATVRSTLSPHPADDLPAGFGTRLAEFVARELEPVPAGDSNVAANDASNNGSPNATSAAGAKAQNGRVNGHTKPPAFTAQQPRAVERSHRRRTLLTAIAAVVAFATVGLATYFAVRQPSNDAKEPLTDNRDSEIREKQAPQPDEPQRPDRNPVYDKSPEPQVIVKTPPKTPGGSSPDTVPLPKVKSPGIDDRKPKPEEVRFVQAEWSDVSGVIAWRKQDADRWSGVRSAKTNGALRGPMTLRTLPAGWIRAQLKSGHEIVLNETTEVRFSARRRADKSADQTDIDVEHRHGQIAFAGLRTGDRIRMRSGEQTSELQADDNQSAVSLVRTEEGHVQIFVWSGRIRVGDQSIAAGHAVRWSARRIGRQSRAMVQHRWRRRPDRRSAMRNSIVDRLNKSDDLLAALSRNDRDYSTKDAIQSATMGFALDPVATVPVATASRIEARREAAIHWLLAAEDKHPHQRFVIAGIAAAFTFLSGYGVTRVGFDDNPRAIFRTDDEDYRVMEEVFTQFGSDENDCYLIVGCDDLFSHETLSQFRRFVDELGRIDGVESVNSLIDERLVTFKPTALGFAIPQPLLPPKGANATAAEYDQARRDALKHPLIRGNLLSDDAKYTMVRVRLAGDALSISQIKPIQQELLSLARKYSQDGPFEIHLTGVPAIRAEAFTLVQDESKRFTVLCSIAALLMAIVILRSWQMVVVVCTASLIGVLWTVGTLGLVSEDIHALTVVLPMLVMVVGFTDSLHLAVDIRRSRAEGLAPPVAARDALRHLTAACGLTSFTTAVGFASLGVTRTEIVRRFGLACGMGAVMTFVAVIVLVPLLTSTHMGHGMLPPKRGRNLDKKVAVAGLALINLVLRFRWVITAAGVVLAIGMALTASRLTPEHEIRENLPDNSESARALQLADQHFGGILPSFVLVEWPEGVTLTSPELHNALADVHQVCEQGEVTNHPFSILTLAEAVPNGNIALLPKESVERLAKTETRRAVVVCRSPELGASQHSRAFAELAERLKELEDRHDGFRFRLTGSGVVISRNLGQMIVDLASSLGLASVVIFITLSIAFRSLRIGLICIVPNALPLLLTASLLVWWGEPLRFSGVIVFCVCLGVAVDDTIHVVNRYRRELQIVGDVDEALRRSVQAVGSALLITTMVLIVGFSITLTSAIPSNRMFGALSCCAIGSALIGDLVVLPAMLSCFAKRTK